MTDAEHKQRIDHQALIIRMESQLGEHQGIGEELQQRLDDQHRLLNELARRNIELASRCVGLVAQLDAESAPRIETP